MRSAPDFISWKIWNISIVHLELCVQHADAGRQAGKKLYFFFLLHPLIPPKMFSVFTGARITYPYPIAAVYAHFPSSCCSSSVKPPQRRSCVAANVPHRIACVLRVCVHFSRTSLSPPSLVNPLTARTLSWGLSE